MGLPQGGGMGVWGSSSPVLCEVSPDESNVQRSEETEEDLLILSPPSPPFPSPPPLPPSPHELAPLEHAPPQQSTPEFAPCTNPALVARMKKAVREPGAVEPRPQTPEHVEVESIREENMQENMQENIQENILENVVLEKGFEDKVISGVATKHMSQAVGRFNILEALLSDSDE